MCHIFQRYFVLVVSYSWQIKIDVVISKGTKLKAFVFTITIALGSVKLIHICLLKHFIAIELATLMFQ
jgi:hypothetical protein